MNEYVPMPLFPRQGLSLSLEPETRCLDQRGGVVYLRPHSGALLARKLARVGKPWEGSAGERGVSKFVQRGFSFRNHRPESESLWLLLAGRVR